MSIMKRKRRPDDLDRGRGAFPVYPPADVQTDLVGYEPASNETTRRRVKATTTSPSRRTRAKRVVEAEAFDDPPPERAAPWPPATTFVALNDDVHDHVEAKRKRVAGPLLDEFDAFIARERERDRPALAELRALLAERNYLDASITFDRLDRDVREGVPERVRIVLDGVRELTPKRAKLPLDEFYARVREAELRARSARIAEKMTRLQTARQACWDELRALCDGGKEGS